MRRFIAVLLILTLVISLVSVAQAAEVLTTENYTITVPEGWSIKQKTGRSFAYEYPDDQFAGAYLYIEELPTDYTGKPDSFYDLYLFEQEKDEKTRNVDLKNHFSILGQNAIIYTDEYTIGAALDVRRAIFAIMRNGTVFTITYISNVYEYDAMLPALKQIVESLVENTPSEPTTEQSVDKAEESGEKGFLFRNIPWYSYENTVKDAMKNVIPGTRKPKTYENCKLNSMELETIDFDTRVETGGDLVIYYDVTVAGYDTSLLALQFMYPITDENTIDRTSAKAEFYMAQYRIGKQQYENVREIYDDLIVKLNTLYGNGTEIDNTHTVWKAPDGSMIGIVISYSEIELTYLAPDADSRLNALKVIVDKEVADKEAAERESNSSNFDGL